MGVDRFDRCRTKPLSGSADGFDSNICQFWESFLKDQVLEEGNHGNLSSSNMPASSSLPSSYGCHGNSSLSFRAILHFLLSRSPLPSFLMRNGAGRGRAAERAAAAEKKKRGRSEVLRRVGAGGRKQCHRPSLAPPDAQLFQGRRGAPVSLPPSANAALHGFSLRVRVSIGQQRSGGGGFYQTD